MAAKDDDKAGTAQDRAKAARQKDKERAAKAKEKEKAAKAKEKAARQKDKERAAKAKEKEKAAKAKEKAARQKDKERAARAKDKERAAKAKEKEKAAKAKEKERAAKAKEKEKAARAKEKAATQKADKGRATREQSAAGRAQDDARSSAGTDDGAALRTDREKQVADGAAQAPVQPVEEVAAPERGETTEVPEQAREQSEADGTGAQSPAAQVGPLPDEDKTVRPKGYIAEALGKEDVVGRSTQRPTIAASYTTRDHDVIRAWAESRGGVPADVTGTGRRGRGGAGVLRIEFPDGPRDDSRLEGTAWPTFFETFDASDVDFLYQERVRTGGISRFHKIVRADA